jgi:hypothetical protein
MKLRMIEIMTPDVRSRPGPVPDILAPQAGE